MASIKGFRGTPTERFHRKLTISDSGCWIWKGSKDHGGYGWIHINGRAIKAHRFAYETFVGPIPEGLEPDHLCRIRACVNPDHLEPVTRRENILRGDGPKLTRERKRAIVQCPQGHPYDQVNTYHRYGHRYCKTCIAQRKKHYRSQAKERKKDANIK